VRGLSGREIEAVNEDVDVCHDVETGAWYLLEYQHAPPYDTRTSEDYESESDARNAYHFDEVVWSEWS
jgi:hypothetical protein